MCELMGMCFEKTVGAEVSIREFALRDFENADGWGLAWYHEGSLTLVKEPLSWRKSKYARFLVSYERLESHIFIGHVRHATVGGPPKHADTHPFSRELSGRHYCFAHNGTVSKAFESFQVQRYHPIGDTDSEYIFCLLLDRIADRGAHLDSGDDWNWFHAQLAMLNELGKLNCLMSDGKRLFCYHDVNGFKGLHMHGAGLDEHEERHLDDPGVSLDIESDDATNGVVVATRPLNESPWHAFRKGELVVIESGKLIFSSSRSRIAQQPRSHAMRDI
jgi:predicted glutamine amidotransferase